MIWKVDVVFCCGLLSFVFCCFDSATFDLVMFFYVFIVKGIKIQFFVLVFFCCCCCCLNVANSLCTCLEWSFSAWIALMRNVLSLKFISGTHTTQSTLTFIKHMNQHAHWTNWSRNFMAASDRKWNQHTQHSYW